MRYSKNNFEMECDFRDLRSAAMVLMTNGDYEPQISLLLAGLLSARSSNPVFVDVGANEGFHSINLATKLPNLRVNSFEPNPALVARLKRNIELNGLEDVIEVYPLGLGKRGDSDGTLHVPVETGSAGASLMDLHPEEGKAETLEVQLVPLDSLSLLPDVIKADVEGAELSVIEGALGTIRQSKPYLVVELLRKWMAPFGAHPNDVIRLLKAEGYSCMAIGNVGLREIHEVKESTEETNFLFVPENGHSALEKMRFVELTYSTKCSR